MVSRVSYAWAAWTLVSIAILCYTYLPSMHPFSDERQYLEIAANLAGGQGYAFAGSVTAYRPPVWPIALAVGLASGIPPSSVAVMSGLCLIGASLAARSIASAIAGSVVGWVAAFGMLLYPLNAYTAATLYPQSLTTLLFLMPIAVLLRDRPGRWAYILSGLCLIGLILSAPTMTWTAGLILIWASWRSRFQIGNVLIIATSAALPLFAWTARNFATFHAIVPISTSTGVNLLLGNNPSATASSGVGADISRYTAAASGMNEVVRDRYLANQALVWITGHLSDAALLYVQKLANYFAPYNTPQTGGTGGSIAAVISWATFIPLLVFAFARFGLRRRLAVRSPEILLISLFISNAAFMAIAFTRTRFRQPLDACLIIEASVVVGLLIGALAKRQSVSWHYSDARSTNVSDNDRRPEG